MAEYLTNTADMTIVADAIRAKGGTSDPLEFPQGMADAVAAISRGGEDGIAIVVTPTRESYADQYNLGFASYNAPIKSWDITRGKDLIMPRGQTNMTNLPTGCTVTIRGTNKDAPESGSDVFRQLTGVTEITFVDGWYPKETWRTFYQMSSPTGSIKIKGVFLDSLTSMKDIGFQSSSNIDIEWAGTLANDATLYFNSNRVSPETVKRLIPLLHDYSAGPAHTLTIGSAVSNLTQEEIQTANARGWTIA